MSRTVSVRLFMDVADYIRGARDSTKETEGLVGKLHEAAKASDETAMAMARTAAEAENAKRGVKGLAGGFDSLDAQLKQTDAALEVVDVQIGKTRKEIGLLALQAAATNDVEIFKSLRSKRGELGILNNVRKELTTVKTELEKSAEDAARMSMGAIKAILSQLGPMLSAAFAAVGALGTQLQGMLIPILIGLGAALSPLLGGIIGSAVLGSVGLGGIVGGVLLASKDPRVSSAASDLGATISLGLKTAGASFVPATLKSIEIIRAAFHSLEPTLSGIFKMLSGELPGLSRGLAGFGTNLMPGLKEAMAASLPILRILAQELPRLGSAFSDMFGSIAKGGDGAAMAFKVFMDLVEGTIRGVGWFIGTLGQQFANMAGGIDALGHGLEKAFGWIPVVGSSIKGVTGYWDNLGHTLGAVKGMTGDAALGFTGLGAAAMGAADQMKALKDAFDLLFGIQMTVDRATIKYKQTIGDLAALMAGFTGTALASAKALDNNTDSGRKSRTEILDQIDAIKALRQANIDNGMSIADADRQYSAQIAQLEKTAIALGFNRDQVRQLIAIYRGIPGRVDTMITVQQQAALDAIRRVEQHLAGLHDRDIHIGVFYTITGDLKVPGGTLVRNERGGVYEHAASGVLREAATYSPQGPARYAFAEPATGGEAFIPRRGDMARSRSIWGYVGENWLGMQPARSMSGGSGRPVVNVTVVAHGGSETGLMRELMRGLRYEIKYEGGNVQQSLGT